MGSYGEELRTLLHRARRRLRNFRSGAFSAAAWSREHWDLAERKVETLQACRDFDAALESAIFRNNRRGDRSLPLQYHSKPLRGDRKSCDKAWHAERVIDSCSNGRTDRIGTTL